MQYLRNTKEPTLTIRPDDNPKWLVDGSYAQK